MREVVFWMRRPFTIHLISAGGLDGAVLHCSGISSCSRASDGPAMDTCDGATVRADGRAECGRTEFMLSAVCERCEKGGEKESVGQICYLHITIRSTSALSGVCDMMLLASQRKRALLSAASAVNVYTFSDMRAFVLRE